MIRRVLSRLCVSATVAGVAAAGASLAGQARAFAAEAAPPQRDARQGPFSAERPLPPIVAVAIGQLQETDGSSSTVDLRAGTRGERTGGSLRLFSPGEGYYNGAVRTLSVANGAITAGGAGGLFRPDGTRIPVRFTATLSTGDRQTRIALTGRHGFGYTMEGRLSPGLVKAGDPRALLAAARATRPPASGVAPDATHPPAGAATPLSR